MIVEVACSAPPDLGFFQKLSLQPVSFFPWKKILEHSNSNRILMYYVVSDGEEWWFFKAVVGVKNQNLKTFSMLVVFVILFECL